MAIINFSLILLDINRSCDKHNMFMLVLTNTLSLNISFFPPISIFHQEQPLDRYPIKSTFDWSSLVLLIISSYLNSLFKIVKGGQGHRGR